MRTRPLHNLINSLIEGSLGLERNCDQFGSENLGTWNTTIAVNPFVQLRYSEQIIHRGIPLS